MAIKFANNASATLSASITSSATSIALTTGQGALFPSLASGEYFYATLVDSAGNLEIVRVTARSTDTLTVVRGQDGTTARAFASGDSIELRPVAAALSDISGATGGSTDRAFYENDKTITTNYTLSANKNAGTFGPVTVNAGVTVTVPSGSVWTIV